ncbi:MAG: ATP-dependent metallopeptidase FtsH/Yme1/Tma family protein [Candidatus Nealsonbacteria bacterium]|nr:ATP-dependent metallopeptidase FtsH/Yme1/Tma family protein [Candidatus Nealsonbacteria bacterium]
MKSLFKNFIFVLLIFLAISGIFALFSQPFEKTNEISLTKLVEDINQEKVKKITVSGNSVEIIYQDDSAAKAKKETESSFTETLANYGLAQEKINKVDIAVKEERGLAYWLGPISVFVLPLLIFGLFFWMIFRQAKAGATQAFNFSKARARLFGAEGHGKERITFKDVAGLKEAKEELKEIVDFLKNPKKFLDMGARIPRGVLLMGAPGTGKTLLARAVAGEARVPFFHISGSEFVEMFVGVGAARVRDLFETAKKSAPSILFIDELDAVGRHRGAGLGGGHDEREQTLNQILVEMDGFERDTNVIVTAATNRPDILDPALLRPGRFDRRVILDEPDVNDREAILDIHVKGKPLALNVNLKEVAERTPGFAGADLANLVNEAAILAARRNKTQIYQEELLESIDKVLLGPERRSHILSEKEKRIAAYHEAGHALVSSFMPESEPVRKISIVARGRAAGYTLKLPTQERRLRTRGGFLSELASLLGGFVAEKMVFGDITTGASNDLEKASELARKLVKEYGMSEKLGPIAFGEKEELVFLGKELGEQRNYSEKIAAEIDEEVSKFIKDAQNAAQKTIKQKRAVLDKIGKALFEKETIEREEFEKLIKPGKKTMKESKTVKAGKFKIKRV